MSGTCIVRGACVRECVLVHRQPVFTIHKYIYACPSRRRLPALCSGLVRSVGSGGRYARGEFLFSSSVSPRLPYSSPFHSDPSRPRVIIIIIIIVRGGASSRCSPRKPPVLRRLLLLTRCCCCCCCFSLWLDRSMTMVLRQKSWRNAGDTFVYYYFIPDFHPRLSSSAFRNKW